MTQAFPLQWPEGWPRTAPHMRTYNHQLRLATFDRSRIQLQRELSMMQAKNVVLSTSIPLRNDGEPYATLRPVDGDSGVAVYFTLRGKQMAMARDCYENVAQNLRSLSLAIEHLRGLDRHGGAHMLERAFAGFAQLPPPEGTAAPAVDWREQFGPFPDELPPAEILALAEIRYRSQSKTAHADVGGNDELMIRMNLAIAQARQELG